MNSIKVNERVFKKILTSLKDCVAKDSARPALQYIRPEIKTDRIVGYSPCKVGDSVEEGRRNGI